MSNLSMLNTLYLDWIRENTDQKIGPIRKVCALKIYAQ